MYLHTLYVLWLSRAETMHVVFHPHTRLFDVIHTDKKLTLVFEFLGRLPFCRISSIASHHSLAFLLLHADQDLKKYLDACGDSGLETFTIKVFPFIFVCGNHHRNCCSWSKCFCCSRSCTSFFGGLPTATSTE